jgi:hypothetical protein
MKSIIRFTKTTFVSMLFWGSAVAFAADDGVRQDWMPSAVDLPEDAEVLIDREIGSAIRLFSISTAEEVDELLSRWRDALDADGYTISEVGVGSMERAIEFSGQGISNAKIVVALSSAEGRHVIEFDATLN